MKKETQIKKLKKAAISIDFLIGTILLILGFAIVLIFYFNIGGTTKIDKNICHESVLLRATLPTLAQGYVPLKCRTEKICITSGLLGDVLKTKSCEDFVGESGIVYMKVKSITDVEKVYADTILSCWEMMGEGKASLFSQALANTYGFTDVFPTCSICSRIAFDKANLNLPTFDFSRMDVSRYMMTHLIPNKNITYFEYMASEDGKASIKDGLFSESKTIENSLFQGSKTPASTTGTSTESGNSATVTVSDISSDSFDQQARNKNLQLEQSAVLFMQLSSPKHGQTIKNTLVTIAGAEVAGFIIAPGITKKANNAVMSACTKGWEVCAVLAVLGVLYQQVNVAYNRAVTAGYCGDVSVGTEARDGCSVVRTVSYNFNDISSYCTNIESIA